jgi:hypothetical protein
MCQPIMKVEAGEIKPNQIKLNLTRHRHVKGLMNGICIGVQSIVVLVHTTVFSLRVRVDIFISLEILSLFYLYHFFI